MMRREPLFILSVKGNEKTYSGSVGDFSLFYLSHTVFSTRSGGFGYQFNQRRVVYMKKLDNAFWRGADKTVGAVTFIFAVLGLIGQTSFNVSTVLFGFLMAYSGGRLFHRAK